MMRCEFVVAGARRRLHGSSHCFTGLDGKRARVKRHELLLLFIVRRRNLSDG